MNEITAGDESYTHQLVAPASAVIHPGPTWAERCYHLLFVDETLMVATGRQVYPYDGRRAAFAGVSTGLTEFAVRAGDSHSAGEDPDRPDVGPITVEVVRPLREIRLRLDEPGLPVSFDLSYRSRFPAIPTERNVIEQDGRVVTDYMNFFQPGVYSGTVSIDGVDRRIVDRAGFRDRGWGLRKHEGSPARGLVVFCACELPDASLYVLVYETASGRRVFTNGWMIEEGGVADLVDGVEHDLTFQERLLQHGVFSLRFASGRTATLSFEVRNRIFMTAIGYTSDPEGRRPAIERYDLSDPTTTQRLFGQIDNGCTFDLDGTAGHGFVETGLGRHAAYSEE